MELTLIVRLRFMLCHMKGIFVLRNRPILFAMLLILIHVPSALAEELTSAKEADIKRLMDMTGALKIAQQFSNVMTEQMTQAIKNVKPDIPPEMFDIVRDEVNKLVAESLYDKNGLVELTIPIYHKYLTHNEIKGLISFYQTELGRKVIEVMPALMQECMVAGQHWGQALGPVIEHRVIERFKKSGIDLTT